MAFQYRNVYWLWLSAAVMLLDQISKQLIVRNLGWFARPSMAWGSQPVWELQTAWPKPMPMRL